MCVHVCECACVCVCSMIACGGNGVCDAAGLPRVGTLAGNADASNTGTRRHGHWHRVTKLLHTAISWSVPALFASGRCVPVDPRQYAGHLKYRRSTSLAIQSQLVLQYLPCLLIILLSALSISYTGSGDHRSCWPLAVVGCRPYFTGFNAFLTPRRLGFQSHSIGRVWAGVAILLADMLGHCGSSQGASDASD
jgi:hypothetical protein